MISSLFDRFLLYFTQSLSSEQFRLLRAQYYDESIYIFNLPSRCIQALYDKNVQLGVQ